MVAAIVVNVFFFLFSQNKQGSISVYIHRNNIDIFDVIDIHIRYRTPLNNSVLCCRYYTYSVPSCALHGVFV